MLKRVGKNNPNFALWYAKQRIFQTLEKFHLHSFFSKLGFVEGR
jgi:hypothetical protein